MQVTQIKDLVNSALQEVDGTSELLKDDLSNVVDIGSEIFNTDNVDNYVKKLVDRIGQTIFNNRVYQGSAPSILKSAWEYGSVLEKVDTELPQSNENPSWQLQDGQEYKQDIFYQPKVSAKFFNSKVTFEIPMSFTQQQVKSSFNSPTELNGFLSMLMTSVSNRENIDIDNLIMRTINNMTAVTVNGNKPLTNINLLTEYSKVTGNTTTVDKALTDKDFLRFATAFINTYEKRLTVISTLFNLGGKERFTPSASQKLILLSDFADSSNTYLKADTFNSSDVGLNGSFDTVPYWQGTGTNYTFNDTSAIDVAIKDGSNTKEVKQSGILGVLADNNALGVACENQRTTTATNARAEFYTNFTKFDAMYFNDTNENYIVFSIANPTATK